MKDHQKPKNYNTYVFTTKQKLLYAAEGMGIMFAVGYVFYHHVVISLIFSLSGLYFIKIKKKQLIARQKQELNIQFKDLLYFLSTSLSAGRSLENSFQASLSSLQGLYSEEGSYIVPEVQGIIGKLHMGENIEDCLMDLTKRSKVEDISNFTDVLITCKRKGGNLNEVIRNTSGVIKDRIEIKQEIGVMLAGKKSEQKILCLSPMALILFLTYSAYDFMAPVFDNPAGNMVMTLALFFVIVGYIWSGKIMDISV
ncbi:MAG TPA: pilus assembly protein TadB [Clostridiales bacterium]|nr:pilus assembly protein TadB [Clostridiales bacterium]